MQQMLLSSDSNVTRTAARGEKARRRRTRRAPGGAWSRVVVDDVVRDRFRVTYVCTLSVLLLWDGDIYATIGCRDGLQAALCLITSRASSFLCFVHPRNVTARAISHQLYLSEKELHKPLSSSKSQSGRKSGAIAWCNSSSGCPMDLWRGWTIIHNSWVALLVLHYLSNATSFVLYGITCLIRLNELAALFAAVEENVC